MTLSEIFEIVERIMGAASDEQIDAGLAELRRGLCAEVPLPEKRELATVASTPAVVDGAIG